MRDPKEWMVTCPPSVWRVVLVLLLTSGDCFAQLSDPPISTLSTKQWSGSNGLISNAITSAVQSESGFLWVTSYHGLMRLDGKNVDVFNQKNIPFLKTTAFERAYEDKEGGLWFSSHSNGIIRFNNNEFRPFPDSSDKRLASVHSLLIVNDHSVWVGTASEGLYHVVDNVVQSIGDSVLHDFTILDLITDNQNHLWIATDGNGLVEYDGKTLKQYTVLEGLQSNFVNALAITRTGELLVGTDNGLSIVAHNKITSFRPLDEVQINSIAVDSKDRIWVGADTGLGKIRLNKEFEFATKENGFPYSRITSISFGKEGNIWLSTARNGVIQIKDGGITNYAVGQNLPVEAVTRISHGPGGSILIASDKGEVLSLTNGKFSPVPLKTNLSNSGINDLLTEDDGTLWIATQKGILTVSNKKKETWLTVRDGLPSNEIKRIIKDAVGNLWFVTHSKGIVKFQDGHVDTVYNTSNGLHSNYVGAIQTDVSATIYAGTNGGGLTIIQPDGTIQTRQIKRNDESILIYSIYRDSHGHVWLTTNFGLYHFDGENFKNILLKTPLTGVTFYDWLEDKNRTVWITTNAGVISISKKDLLQFVAGSIPAVETKLYNDNDGILNPECSPAQSLMTSSGIWIPALGGITIINPESIIPDEGVSAVFIQSLKTDDLTLIPDSRITVKPGNNRYTISFTTPNLNDASRVEFRYKLDKVDRFWVSAGTKRQAEYTNLSPGSYTFQVIASRNQTTWTKKPAALSFNVAPFFYQTGWFSALVITLGAFILFAIYKWRVRVIQKANRELIKVNGELDRFVYSASHDLRSPLSSILGLIALSRIEDAKVTYTYITKIEDCVKILDKLILDIIDFSSNSRAKQLVEEINFHKLLDEVITAHQYMSGFKEFKWKVIINEGSMPFYSDPRRVKIILSNLISNSVKYRNPQAGESFVAIDISCQHALSTISIADNGIGIPAEHIDKVFDMFYRAHSTSQGSGLGLYIVKETIAKLRGKITVDSEPGRGTTFRISLPSLTRTRFKTGLSWKKLSSLSRIKKAQLN